jgi:hypothetical protein
MAMNREYHRAYMKEWYARKKGELVALLGGRCVKCGTTDGLTFDHIDPSTKKMPIGKMTKYSIEEVREGAMKCQLLCKGCHITKTKANKDNPSAKLTDEEVTSIRTEYSSGMVSQRALGLKYGVTNSVISETVRHKIHKEV